MYKELDILLSAETTLDSWYDDGCIIAGEVLSDFNQDDWEVLASHVLAKPKPIEWQKKLAYCMDSKGNIYELQILVELVRNNEDEELLEIVIDTLRSFTSTVNKKIIIENPFIIVRVKELLPISGVAVKKILEDFLEKVSQ